MEYINEFRSQCIYQIKLNVPRIQKCLDQLTEDEIWEKANESSNSIGNLILHLCGNIRQYAISSLGNLPDTRQRDEEFSVVGGFSGSELMKKLETTVQQACEIIRTINPEELLRKRKVQAFEYSGIGVIIHVTEHFSYHSGQIAFWTKELTNMDLGFYSGINLGNNN